MKANYTCYRDAPDDWVWSIGGMTGTHEEQLAGERQLTTLCGYKLT